MRQVTIDRNLLAVAALASILPVLAVIVLFPTPAIDLREHINWGVSFPLYTWKHPPLQSWLAGLVALTSARDAWAYVVVAQALNLVALYYIVRTAAEFIAKDAAVPVGAAFCGVVTFSLAVPDMALNADLLQTPLWLGVLFHALRAARDDRWADWLAAAAFAALAVLAKYFSLLFLASLALALTLQRRSILSRPGFYVAGLVALVILSPHLIQLWAQSDAMLAYGLGRTVKVSASLTDRLWWLGVLFATLALYNAGPLVSLGDAAWRGQVRLRESPRQGARGVIVDTCLILLALMSTLIVVVGFDFRTRFAVPMLPLGILLIASTASIAPDAAGRFSTIILILTAGAWAAAVVLALAFPQVYVREPPVPRLYLRDPAPEAAALIKADWKRRFACGPGYIVGADAHAVGLYFGGDTIGLSNGDVRHAQWFHRSRLRDLGAVVVGPSKQAVRRSAMPPTDRAVMAVLSLRRRRWPYGPERQYVYYFVPPHHCGTAVKDLGR
jgi:dolichyl-phosphate-mannose-protein mannosyltransferase